MQPLISNPQLRIMENLPADFKFLAARVNVNFNNLSTNGGTDTLTVTITGASVGDGVNVYYTVDPTNSMVVQGWVSSTDTVTLRATNCTPGSYNPPAQDFIVIVAKVA